MLWQLMTGPVPHPRLTPPWWITAIGQPCKRASSWQSKTDCRDAPLKGVEKIPSRPSSTNPRPQIARCDLKLSWFALTAIIVSGACRITASMTYGPRHDPCPQNRRAIQKPSSLAPLAVRMAQGLSRQSPCRHGIAQGPAQLLHLARRRHNCDAPAAKDRLLHDQSGKGAALAPVSA